MIDNSTPYNTLAKLTLEANDEDIQTMYDVVQMDAAMLNTDSLSSVAAAELDPLLESKEADAKTWLVSGKYSIANTPWTAKAQYISTDFGTKDSEEVAVGAEYAFNKATTGHIYAGQISRDNYKDDTIVGTGIEYKF